MRVEFLDLTAFEDEASFAHLEQILVLISEGWHNWYWPDPGEVQGSEFFQRMAHHRELALKSFTNDVAYGSGRSLFVLGSDEDSTPDAYRLRLPEAAALLCKPLKVLVENSLSDGRFLSLLIAAVDPATSDLFGGLRPRAEWSHGGGKTEIAKLLRALRDEATERGLPARVLALVDSDARWPGDAGLHTAEVKEAGIYAHAPVHVLGKRSIENYVSDRLLDEYVDAYPDIAASASFIRALSRTQRDHFPIKSGLREDPHVKECELYADLDLAAAQEARLPRLIEYVLNEGSVPNRHDVVSRHAEAEIEEVAATIWENL